MSGCNCAICRLSALIGKDQAKPAAPSVPAGMLDLKAALERALGPDVSVRLVNVDELFGKTPAPTHEVKATPAKPEPEEWGIFIDHGDGRGMNEDKGPRLPSQAAAEKEARMTAAGCRLLGVPMPKWEVRRVVSPAAEIAMLRARVATLVESEARAVAGEKAAREALGKIDLKRIREVADDLRDQRWTNTAEYLLAAIGDAPKVEA